MPYGMKRKKKRLPKKKEGFLSNIVGRVSKEVDMIRNQKPAFGNVDNARRNARSKRQG